MVADRGREDRASRRMSNRKRYEKWALGFALASYVYGFFSVFGLGLLGFDHGSATAYCVRLSGAPFTLLLNTRAIMTGRFVRKEVDAPLGARTMAAWAIGLGIVGFVGTASYFLWLIGFGIAA